MVIREVDGEFLVLDRQSEKVHQLNAAASFILKRCDGASSVRSIAEELAQAYGLPLANAEYDVAATIKRFQELGLLNEPD